MERLIQGYRTKPKAIQVTVAEQALRACGYEPRHIITGGASDAAVFEAAGLPCTNLADGTEHNHEPTERISVDALEDLLLELGERHLRIDGPLRHGRAV